jgi:hypothetical protein
VEINAALAADLAILSGALDDPDADLLETLRHLAAAARCAVPSYLGLMVTVTGSDPPIAFRALEHAAEGPDLRTSLVLTSPDVGADGAGPRVSVVLFAGVPGAFVDLAADLSWTTGRRLADVVLDQHQPIHAGARDGATLHDGAGLAAASAIDQAIGVLIGRGYTDERARRELETRAAYAGTDPHRAAELILATLPAVDARPDAGPG